MTPLLTAYLVAAFAIFGDAASKYAQARTEGNENPPLVGVMQLVLDVGSSVMVLGIVAVAQWGAPDLIHLGGFWSLLAFSLLLVAIIEFFERLLSGTFGAFLMMTNLPGTPVLLLARLGIGAAGILLASSFIPNSEIAPGAVAALSVLYAATKTMETVQEARALSKNS